MRKTREQSRKKIDDVIKIFVEQERDDNKEEMREFLDATADVVFGIWQSLDEISMTLRDRGR